jgi:hypothetical protein
MRIAICIEGGCLRTVLCDRDADVELIDMDNAADTENGVEEAEARLEILATEMIEVM